MVKEIESIFECKKDTVKLGNIPICSYQKTVDDEVADGTLTRQRSINLLKQMHAIRALEDMLVQLKAGIYKPLKDFDYIGPTHLSIGQEVQQGGFMSEIITRIQEEVFDWLDAPIQRLGAPNSIPASAQNLEKIFLPDAQKLVDIIKQRY